jgi:predicted ATPase/DNA-binding SARP family transcriptional activator
MDEPFRIRKGRIVSSPPATRQSSRRPHSSVCLRGAAAAVQGQPTLLDRRLLRLQTARLTGAVVMARARVDDGCVQLDTHSPAGGTALDLRVLGPMRAIRAGRDLPLGGPKQRSVLALLLLDAGRVVPSERLVDELWHGRPRPGAAKTLRSYVSRLRTLLRPDAVLIARGRGYVLELEQASVDAARFERLVSEGQAALARGAARVATDRFRQGLGLWRGRAFADVADVESVGLESTRLEELRLTALEGRIEGELGLGLHAELVGDLERLVADHPLRERFWRQLVLALYRSERQAEALEAYSRARNVLTEELGLEPGEHLQRLQQAVLRQEVAAISLPTERHNLPAQLTSFVGRERELAEVERLLGTTRLLTVTGVGGVGKTRLALEAAGRRIERADGVWFVDLSGIDDPTLVPQQVAMTLGLRQSRELSLLELLRNYMRKGEVLLVLDNCEHLLAACAELVQTLLQGAPTFRTLATSREPLGVPGETEYALPPLGVPPEDVAPEELVGFAAVRLFLERSAARADVAATSTTVATVARICRDLDGIPLAIELAAARTKALSVDEIAARLDDRFDFLKYWRRVAVPRHQTLRATMDWSYELLSERERKVLRRLSVFAGGFTLRAAAYVCAGGNEAAALDVVTRLVERSLVVADLGEHGARYRLLETVRQYALERLAEVGEVDATRRAHAMTFLSLAEEAPRPEEDVLLRLAPEQDNVRAALEWSFAAHEESAPRLVCAFGRFWHARGQLEEARSWLERALAAHTAPEELRAELLGLLGTNLWESGDLNGADEKLSEGVRLARAARNRILEARLRVRRGDVQLYLGSVAWRDVLRGCEQTAAILESEGDLFGLADALVAIGKIRLWLGNPSDQDALERAASHARRSGNRPAELLALEWLAVSFTNLRVPTDVAIERQERLLEAVAAEPRSEAGVLGVLALVYGFAGRFAEARQAIARSRALYAEFGATLDWASVAQSVGSIELMAGDPVAAERVLRETYEALIAKRQVGYRSTTALWLAESLYAQGFHEEAEQLVEEAEATVLAHDFIDQVHLRTLRAKLNARGGGTDAAERLLKEAKELVPAGHADLLGEVLLTRGEVLRRAGKPEEAALAIREALRLYEERRVPPLASRARTLLAELDAAPLAGPA